MHGGCHSLNGRQRCDVFTLHFLRDQGVFSSTGGVVHTSHGFFFIIKKLRLGFMNIYSIIVQCLITHTVTVLPGLASFTCGYFLYISHGFQFFIIKKLRLGFMNI
jgi:hypothetical protein